MTSDPSFLDDPSKPAPTQPVVARMWDYYLGGNHSYAVDREAAEKVMRTFAPVKPTILENRAFLKRAVRWLAKNGVTQFIDIGSGLPTVSSTHEAALKVRPDSRILYVDIVQSVVEEGTELIRKAGCDKQVGMITASALEPDAIFHDSEARRIIDFGEPVAIIMCNLVHFFTTSQYVPMLDFWKSRLAKGSAFVMSHTAIEEMDPDEVARVVEIYKKTATPTVFRPLEEISLIMDGWELVEPGVVKANCWKVEECEDGEAVLPGTSYNCVGVGRLR